MCKKLSVQNLSIIIVWSFIIVLILLASKPLFAADNSYVKSISYSNKTALDKIEKDERLNNATVEELQPIVSQGYRQEANTLPLAAQIANYSASDISLYDTTTELISDQNHDGFYHRFSVSIDADTKFDVAYIYAKIYLSYEGGPWHHYVTSDSFHIYANSEDDIFTVETELADGFASGFYDVRIELYDGDYFNRILSYGPYDDTSLSALPLQDSYEDTYYLEEVSPLETQVIISGSTHGHGATGYGLATLPLAMVLLRRRRLKLNK